MKETYSKSRQQAEIAFGKEQTEFFARGQAVEVQESLNQARDEKTQRLREARKAMEMNERMSIAQNLLVKRTSKG